MKRDYVVVCVRHMRGSELMFWGGYTKDNEKRSFGGYTTDLDRCERYTEQEINNSSYNFPFYNKNMAWKKEEDFAIKISELKEIYSTKQKLSYWENRAVEAEELLKEIIPATKYQSCDWSEWVRKVNEFLGGGNE
jgi:hypothetical protein